nr:MAG TPA: hypothetical protein [Caudoviricetes sp.]
MLQSALQLSELENRDSRNTGRIFPSRQPQEQGLCWPSLRQWQQRPVERQVELRLASIWDYSFNIFSIRDYPPSFWDEMGIGLA